MQNKNTICQRVLGSSELGGYAVQLASLSGQICGARSVHRASLHTIAQANAHRSQHTGASRKLKPLSTHEQWSVERAAGSRNTTTLCVT